MGMSLALKDGLLAGKVAFVAGASSGINLGVAAGYAEAGARVALISRSAEKIAAMTRSGLLPMCGTSRR
jgi:NAD(P)-dependent dehydrogenase (short-subunit alcohol dehydrogenase family)